MLNKNLEKTTRFFNCGFFFILGLSFQSTVVLNSKSGIHNNKTIYILNELDPRLHDEYIYELGDDKEEVKFSLMKIDIITLFPTMFTGPLTESIVSRAQKRGLVEIKIHQLRDWAINRRGQVDDSPYGGGPGMIMRVDVAYSALKIWLQKNPKLQIPNNKQITNSKSQKEKPYIILPTPLGKKFDQAMARRLAKKKHLVFLCPHYEGYDKRIESLVDEKISIGDYVLTGGELPVAVMVDAVVRLIPGVIKADSLKEESFSTSPFLADARSPSPYIRRGKESPEGASRVRYEYPQYTRPEIFEVKIKGRKIKKRVPKVLLSGNHAEIKKWREKMSR